MSHPFVDDQAEMEGDNHGEDDTSDEEHTSDEGFIDDEETCDIHDSVARTRLARMDDDDDITQLARRFVRTSPTLSVDRRDDSHREPSHDALLAAAQEDDEEEQEVQADEEEHLPGPPWVYELIQDNIRKEAQADADMRTRNHNDRVMALQDVLQEEPAHVIRRREAVAEAKHAREEMRAQVTDEVENETPVENEEGEEAPLIFFNAEDKADYIEDEVNKRLSTSSSGKRKRKRKTKSTNKGKGKRKGKGKGKRRQGEVDFDREPDIDGRLPQFADHPFVFVKKDGTVCTPQDPELGHCDMPPGVFEDGADSYSLDVATFINFDDNE